MDKKMQDWAKYGEESHAESYRSMRMLTFAIIMALVVIAVGLAMFA